MHLSRSKKQEVVGVSLFCFSLLVAVRSWSSSTGVGTLVERSSSRAFLKGPSFLVVCFLFNGFFVYINFRWYSRKTVKNIIRNQIGLSKTTSGES